MDPKLRELLEALELSFDQIRQKLADAVGPNTWVRDVYDSWFVHQTDSIDSGKSYRRTYVVDKESGGVTLGEPTEVVGQMVWMAVGQEAATTPLDGDTIPLVESAVRPDGTIPIKIIAPGWGSSGFYPAEVLERDGPKVFKAGLHTFWNHPSASGEKDRPERDLRDLAGTLTKDAYWDADGPAGPGLYGEAKVVSAYRDAVAELAPHIGMSIRAFGKAQEGAVDGKHGRVISELASARSVDFVTTAGAGGKILELFESVGREPPAERTDVTEAEAQALQEANAVLTQENARLREGLLLRQAQEAATSVLAKIDMPEATRRRVLTEQAAKPVVVDGVLDESAYSAQVTEAAETEMAYIKEILPKRNGQIVGMGSVSTEEGAGSLVESFIRAGLSKELAEIAAKGRN